MRKTPTILLIVVSALCAMLALDRLEAQPEGPVAKAAPSRVGICDVVTIFNTSKRAADLNVKFEARTQDAKAQAEAKAKQIEIAQKALVDDFKPGTPDYKKRVDEIQEMIIKLRVWEEMRDAAIKRDRYVLTRAMHKQILDAIEVEAKSRGIDVVVHRTLQPPADPSIRELLDRIRTQQVLYARDELDLTSAVLKKVNDAYAKAGDGK